MSFQNIYSKKNLINLIILLIPLNYIAGNLMLNLNIIILIFYVLFLFRLEVFKNKLSIIDKLIIIYFFYIVINGIFNNFFNLSLQNDNTVLIKSFLYTRFLILYFVLKYLIKQDLINYKLLFFSFGFYCLFVSFDLIIQYSFGQDLFGFKGEGRRLGGPFGDEQIAGGFIQRFFIFIPFSLFFFTNKIKNWKIQIIFLFMLLICVLGIMIAGNRMPILLFILSLTMVFVYQKSLRKTLILLPFIIVGSYAYIANANINYTYHIKSALKGSNQIYDYAKTRISTGEIKLLNTYIKEIELGILTWEENKYFGSGVKSFYRACANINNSKIVKLNLEVLKREAKVNCNIHPHNYYIQILAELGIMGLFLSLFLFILIFLKTVKKIHFTEDSNKKFMIIVPFFITFITELFPLKTTGNFFTSTNATFLFIIISFIVGLLEVRKNNYYDKK